MKKNYLFGLFALTTMLFTASCQEEDVVKQGQAGAEATVSINVTTPEMGVATRTFGDGKTAQTLHYAVYNVKGEGNSRTRTWLQDLTVENKTFELSTTVDLQLVTGNTYDVIFWADTDGNAPYSINWNDGTVSVDYDNVTSNNENYDAFFNWMTIEVNGAQTESIKLYRPFGQLNIGTSDIDEARKAGFTIAQTSVTVPTYETLNLWTKEVADPKTVTFGRAAIPNGEAFPVTGYEYLAMNYLLLPVDKELVKVIFDFYSDVDEAKNRVYTSVPVQRNWRTNIYGQLMTSEVDVNVAIEPWFDGAHNVYNVTVDGVSYSDFAEAAAKAMELDKPIDFVENVEIDADATITIPEGKTLTLNLNGNTLSGVTDDADKNDDGQLTSADNEVMFDVRGTMNVNDGIITIKHESDNFGWNGSTEIFYVGFNGTLNVENATLENYGGSDMAYAIDMVNATDITVNVENSTIKSSYIPVRVFNNSSTGMNNVTIMNSTLEGTSRAFWVHIYTQADDASFFNNGKDTDGNGYKNETLNLNIYNPACKNTFIANDPNRIVEYGFTNEINLNEFGGQLIKTAQGSVVEGVGMMDENTFGVYSAEGFKYVVEQYEADPTAFDGKDIELLNDIDLAAYSMFTRSAATSNWSPIGTEENPFTGTFDGNGCTIKNLVIVEEEAKEGKAYIGFFGYAKNATIKNVTFENVNLNIACLDIDHSQGHIAAVAGSLEGNSTIENVTVKGNIFVESTVTANGASRVAVVAGGNSYGNVTMKNVHVIANEGSYLKANNNVGALAGQLQGKSVFENCSSNIDVTGTKFFAGGIIGLAAGDQLFTDCHTTGDITITAGREGKAHDHYRVGGIAGGWADGAKNVCTLVDCSYTGTLSGTNADGSVAKKFDYWGYVGRGYTLNGCQGSKVVIDGVSFVQVSNTAAEAGIYDVINAKGEYLVDDANGLVSALEQGKDVILMADIKIDPANMSNAYGKTGINVKNGQTIDGNDHTLDIKGAGGTWDSGINTTGGLIKNLTVTGSFRGIFINHNSTHSEKVVLQNVTITGTVYTLSCDQGLYQGIEATNCTFNGWTSFAKTAGEAKFVNCSFGEGNGYKYCRPYAATEFINCTFCPGYTVDDTQATVTFTDCTWEE